MGLQDLNEELHSRDFHLERVRHATPYEPGVVPPTGSEGEQPEASPTAWVSGRLTEAERVARQAKRKRMLRIGVGVLAAVVLLGGVIFKVRSLLYSEEKVALTVTGPHQVASAETSEFTVTYSNQNWSPLEHASLVVS